VDAPFKDRAHLLRLALLLAAGLVLFLLLRAVAVPKGFGTYGHFRAGALDDIAALPVAHAGHAACEECHDDVVTARKGSRHARIACETCHGPQAKHAADPTSVKPPRPDARTLCVLCHQANIARPQKFPQIDAAAHAGKDICTSCHPHHHPEPA
jgi:hypothetical protein